MELKDIRQQRLKEWFADKKLPQKDASFISQVVRGGKFIGEKAARRLERDHGMPSLYLDTPLDKDPAPEAAASIPFQDTTIPETLRVALEKLNSLPDDDAEKLIKEFADKIEGRYRYYEQKVIEFIQKNKLNDV